MTTLPLLRKDNSSSVNVPPVARDRSLCFFIWTEPTLSFSFFFRDCFHSAGLRTKLVKRLHYRVRSTAKKLADLLSYQALAIWQPLSITLITMIRTITLTSLTTTVFLPDVIAGRSKEIPRRMVCASTNIKYLGTIGSSASWGHIR